ncbi:hypothetical protein C8J57DRAFT_1248995 [Mycena rebaudengoi]|nr:hypothetical protein C8J57DRAFT_1248995 [Mycena rebaudengoi]
MSRWSTGQFESVRLLALTKISGTAEEEDRGVRHLGVRHLGPLFRLSRKGPEPLLAVRYPPHAQWLKQLAFTGVYVVGEGALRVLSRGALQGPGDRVRRGPLTGLKFTGSDASAEASWPRTSRGMNSVT